MSSEHLASAKDHLKGDLGGSWNILEGASGQYPAPQIARRFGGASGAYSLRDIGANGTAVVEVRRDTGGGAGDDDNEDFSAEQITNGALAAFVGSGNSGYVSKWYDQSGNGNHATQTVPANQPKIVDSSSGVLDMLDFFPSANRCFLNISKFLGNGAARTCFVVLSNVETPSEKFYISNRGGGGGGWNFKNDNDLSLQGKVNLAYIGTGAGDRISNDVVISRRSSTKQLIGFAATNTSAELYEGGDLLAANSDALSYVTSLENIGAGKPETTSIGKQGNSTGASGNELKMGEVIVYETNLSADRSLIESDIASYWGITLS